MINYLYWLVYWSWYKMLLLMIGFLELILVLWILVGFFIEINLSVINIDCFFEVVFIKL